MDLPYFASGECDLPALAPPCGPDPPTAARYIVLTRLYCGRTGSNNQSPFRTLRSYTRFVPAYLWVIPHFRDKIMFRAYKSPSPPLSLSYT